MSINRRTLGVPGSGQLSLDYHSDTCSYLDMYCHSGLDIWCVTTYLVSAGLEGTRRAFAPGPKSMLPYLKDPSLAGREYA